MKSTTKQYFLKLLSLKIYKKCDNFLDNDRFWEDSTRTEMKDMHLLAERLSADAYDEIEDHTV
jgi:hypothetical protein